MDETEASFRFNDIRCPTQYFDFNAVLAHPVDAHAEENPPFLDSFWESDDDTKQYFSTNRSSPSRVAALTQPPLRRSDVEARRCRRRNGDDDDDDDDEKENLTLSRMRTRRATATATVTRTAIVNLTTTTTAAAACGPKVTSRRGQRQERQREQEQDGCKDTLLTSKTGPGPGLRPRLGSGSGSRSGSRSVNTRLPTAMSALPPSALRTGPKAKTTTLSTTAAKKGLLRSRSAMVSGSTGMAMKRSKSLGHVKKRVDAWGEPVADDNDKDIDAEFAAMLKARNARVLQARDMNRRERDEILEKEKQKALESYHRQQQQQQQGASHERSVMNSRKHNNEQKESISISLAQGVSIPKAPDSSALIPTSTSTSLAAQASMVASEMNTTTRSRTRTRTRKSGIPLPQPRSTISNKPKPVVAKRRASTATGIVCTRGSAVAACAGGGVVTRRRKQDVVKVVHRGLNGFKQRSRFRQSSATRTSALLDMGRKVVASNKPGIPTQVRSNNETDNDDNDLQSILSRHNDSVVERKQRLGTNAKR